jgi:hypothetical protein
MAVWKFGVMGAIALAVIALAAVPLLRTGDGRVVFGGFLGIAACCVLVFSLVGGLNPRPRYIIDADGIAVGRRLYPWTGFAHAAPFDVNGVRMLAFLFDRSGKVAAGKGPVAFAGVGPVCDIAIAASGTDTSFDAIVDAVYGNAPHLFVDPDDFGDRATAP